jgi:hypothetical protein
VNSGIAPRHEDGHVGHGRELRTGQRQQTERQATAGDERARMPHTESAQSRPCPHRDRREQQARDAVAQRREFQRTQRRRDAMARSELPDGADERGRGRSHPAEESGRGHPATVGAPRPAGYRIPAL